MEKNYKDLRIGREFEVIQAKQQMLQEQTRSALAAFMGSADTS